MDSDGTRGGSDVIETPEDNHESTFQLPRARGFHTACLPHHDYPGARWQGLDCGVCFTALSRAQWQLPKRVGFSRVTREIGRVSRVYPTRLTLGAGTPKLLGV